MLKPVVPLSPLSVKEMVVDEVDQSVASAKSDICEMDTFPPMARSTVAPLSVVTCTVVIGVGLGGEVVIGVGLTVGIGVGVAIDIGDGVSVVEGVGVGVSTNVAAIVWEA